MQRCTVSVMLPFMQLLILISVTSENRHFMSVVEAFSFYQFYGGKLMIY